MLKPIFVVFGVIGVLVLVIWGGKYLNEMPPSISGLRELTSLSVRQNTSILFFDRIRDGIDPEFIVKISVPGGGAKFCMENELRETKLPDVPRRFVMKKYRALVDPPGICYGKRTNSYGDVYVVVRSDEAVIHWIDR